MLVYGGIYKGDMLKYIYIYILIYYIYIKGIMWINFVTTSDLTSRRHWKWCCVEKGESFCRIIPNSLSSAWWITIMWLKQLEAIPKFTIYGVYKQSTWEYMGIMWLKQYKPPMTGNGRHTTYQNGDDWGMTGGWCKWHCFAHITLICFKLYCIQNSWEPGSNNC